jgi:hypothetical protein
LVVFDQQATADTITLSGIKATTLVTTNAENDAGGQYALPLV